jgi:phosphoglycolate phosphatase-like HAD superfamily hydrolase
MRKPAAVILDMDGTLADVRGIRHHLDGPNRDFTSFHAESVSVPPNPDVVRLARQADRWGFATVIVTARRSRWRNVTAWWLADNGVPSTALIMRGDKDMRPDVDVKRDILNGFIRPAWTPVLAVDDNPSVLALWDAEGIPTIRVPGWNA